MAAIALAAGLTLSSMPIAGAEPVVVLAGNTATPTTRTKDIADMDIAELAQVKVSPFEVSSHLDQGYRASNSVSASRFDTPVGDVPYAIQAFTESFIDDQKPINIFDVTRYSPGVTYRSNDFNEGNANLAIRGFAVSSTAGNIQILRDGFHGPSIFDFTNIARVEVVKGPASFLYGQVAPGGIVNVITKSAQPKFAASADARYGSYGQYRFDVDVTGPASDSLLYRFAASYDQDIDYWKPYDAHSRNIAPTVLWRPNERVSVSLKYENFHRSETPQLMQKPGYNRQVGSVPSVSDPNLSGVDVPGLPDNWNGLADADFRQSDTNGLNAWFDLKVDDNWDLRVGYSHQAYKVDALFSGNFGMANNTTVLQGRRVRGQTYDNQGDTYQVDAVGKYRFDGASLRVLLGAQYIDRSFDNWAAQAPNDPALGNDPTASPFPLWDLSDPLTWNRAVTISRLALTENATDQTTDYVDKSVYGGTTLGFLDERLLLLAGWRWTSTQSRLTDHLDSQSQPRLSANKLTPQYGVLYKPTAGLSLFASYAESFVPGTQILNNPDLTTLPAASTEGSGFDIGLKADLLDGRISGTLTFFDIRNKNIVNDLALTNAAGSVEIFNVQSGEQRSRGVELDATARLTDHWQLYFSYSYMNARITEFSGNDAQVLAQDIATLDAAGRANYRNVNLLHNARLQMSAPHLANFWTRYNFTPQALRGFYVGAGVNYVYQQTILPDGPSASRQTYALVSALVGRAWTLRGRSMSVDLMGKNLGNDHYRPSQSTRSRPREFVLTFTVKF